MNATHRRRIRKLADFLAGPVARADAKARRKGRFKFDMGEWCRFNTDDDMETHNYFAPSAIGLSKDFCNTAACALGWATVVFPRNLKLRDGHVVGHGGGRFFGMSKDQFNRAFVPWEAEEYKEIRTPKQAAAVLHEIAKEGE